MEIIYEFWKHLLKKERNWNNKKQQSLHKKLLSWIYSLSDLYCHL